MTKFLTGWATPPSLFAELLPADTEIIDTTKLISQLYDGEELNPLWIEQIIIDCDVKEDDHIIGFSTGAMIALAISSIIPGRLTLFSPALSFVQRSNHPTGIPQEFVKLMRTSLQISSDITLRKFFKDCKLGKCDIDTSYYTQDQLTKGLDFLEKLDLTSYDLAPSHIQIYHSPSDRIISINSGRIVAKKCTVDVIEVKGGHGAILQHLSQLTAEKLF